MHVYVLCRSTVSLTLPAGIVQPLQMIVGDQIAAVVEPDLQLEDLQQEDDRLLRAVLVHDRVIRELFQQTTVLPLRFTAFPSRADLTVDLQANQQHYLATLARLDGKAEMTLKFQSKALAEPPIAPDVKGKEYFLAKKRQHQDLQQQRELQAQELDYILQAISEHYSTVATPDANQVHILVNRDSANQAQARVMALISQFSLWDGIWGEVLPPFHFI